MDHKQVIIGEFFPNPTPGEEVKMSCFFPHRGRLSIVLQDVLGRPRLRKELDMDRGSHTLSFQLPKLKTGEYHAWISFGDQTVIRPLQVQVAEKGLKNIFRKFGF